ncbi:serine-tRNA ligase [Babesia caballi]|uniref:Serine-tRNA ligase n=1 Tax=Babesia caballi TaxID=5871 RepID=A0AAV4LQ53_BABCB|nr:serine-tRNA ligase [Babesia caballi]
MSRQKGAHKGAKTAEVEAVGATGQGGEARVTGEGWGGWAGGLDVSVSFRELGEILERLGGNFVTGHPRVKLSATEAIVIKELAKFTIAVKVFGLPLILAIPVELSQSLVNFFNGGEETSKSFFLGIVSGRHGGGPGGTVVGRGVGALKISRLHNTTLDNLPLFLTAVIPVANKLLQCVGQPDDGTSRILIYIIHNLGQNFLNVIIFFIWLLSYRSGKLFGQAFNGLIIILATIPPTHSQHPVNRLFKVFRRLGKGLIRRHPNVPTNRLTYHNSTPD